MTTKTMPEHVERCRELAEYNVYATAIFSDGTMPEESVVRDPRFASLRGEHETYKHSIECRYCHRYGPWFDEQRCFRTDADALLEATKAAMPNEQAQQLVLEVTKLWLDNTNRTIDSFAEALSAALWQAVFGS